MLNLKSVLVALSLAFSAIAAPAHAESATLSFVSEPGDYIGQGESRSYTEGLSTTVSSDGRIAGVSYWGSSEWWYLDLAAPEGQKLVVGAYEGATRYPFQESTEPGLSLSGSGRGCNTLTGRFEVTVAEYDTAGNLRQFAANFEQHCEGAEPALWGEVSFVKDGPPLALGIDLVLIDKGYVNKKTGAIKVSGEVTCTKSATVNVNGRVDQRVNRFAIAQGTYSASVECGTTPTRFDANIQPQGTPFVQGSGQYEGTASAYDFTTNTYVTDTATGIIHLQNLKK